MSTHPFDLEAEICGDRLRTRPSISGGALRQEQAPGLTLFRAGQLTGLPSNCGASDTRYSDRCFIQIEVGENVAKVIDGHDILIESVDDGAIIGVDTQRFFVSKAPSI
jgi:hypothetical protein